MAKQKFRVGFDPWAAKHVVHPSFISGECKTLHRDTEAVHFCNSGDSWYDSDNHCDLFDNCQPLGPNT